jgi:hypothetical protein
MFYNIGPWSKKIMHLLSFFNWKTSSIPRINAAALLLVNPYYDKQESTKFNKKKSQTLMELIQGLKVHLQYGKKIVVS